MMPAAAADAGAAAAGADSDCTDCSHCAGRSSARGRAGVRVSINMGQFFTDQRARAFMWAPYRRCVQWLGRRVARVFGLPDDIALMSRGHMLPVVEPLLMLDRDDPVEVVNMSYVFTAYDKSNDPNTASQSNANETNRTAPAGRAGSTMSSNIIIKPESTGQQPSSSQGDQLADNLNIGPGNPADDGEDLQRLKRHALRLLDEHCRVHEASAPKRLRRRRRRRRPHAADALDGSEDDEPHAEVLRNGSGTRPPRLVRALSPPPALQHVV